MSNSEAFDERDKIQIFCAVLQAPLLRLDFRVLVNLQLQLVVTFQIVGPQNPNSGIATVVLMTTAIKHQTSTLALARRRKITNHLASVR